MKILLDDVQTKKRVTFREATAADIPALVELAREAHLEGRFRDIPYSAEKAANLARKAIANPKRTGVFLAIKSGAPCGFLWCSVGEYLVGTSPLIATIHALYVCRSVRSQLSGGRAALGLMAGVKSWANARNVREILLHVTLDVEGKRVHGFAKSMGFEVTGGNYAIRN